MPDNLPELRDIHLPEGVSAFPPAYGWWVILAAVVGAVVLYHLLRLLRRKSKKLYALRLLTKAADDSLKSAAQMSEILRRICVYKYPDAAVLPGREWVEFLNRHAKKIKLNRNAAELLLNAPYMPEANHEVAAADVAALRVFCRRWIGENL